MRHLKLYINLQQLLLHCIFSDDLVKCYTSDKLLYSVMNAMWNDFQPYAIIH